MIKENQHALDRLVQKIEKARESKPESKPTPQGGTTFDDNRLVDKMLESKNGDKNMALLKGDWAGAGYPSQNEGDLALCNHLAFWTDRNETQMDRIFRTTGLYREKWDKKHFGDGRTYGQATIQKAIQNTTETYRGHTERHADSDKPRGATHGPRKPRFLNVEAMVKEFGKEICWLYKDLIPKGHPVVLGGREGTGKTSNMAQMSKEMVLSNDNYWVLWVACEGFVGDHTDKWRKLRIPHRVVMLSDDKGVYKLRLDNYQDRKFLDESLQALKDETGGEVVAVVIDSIRGMQSMGENDPKIAAVMSEINSIVCDQHKACCVYIAHHKKGKTEKRSDLLSGTTGIPSSVRAVYSLEKISDCVCRIVPDKGNTLGHTPKSYKSVLIEDDDGFFTIAISEEVDQLEPNKVGKAQEFLIGLFKKQPKIKATDVYTKAAFEGFSGSTIRKAKVLLGIDSKRDEPSGPFFWVWPY